MDLSCEEVRDELLLHRRVERICYRRWQVVYSERTALDRIYYIESGLVKLARLSAFGEEVVLVVAKAGEICGLEALVADGRADSTATMLMDGVLFTIPAEMFASFCENHSAVWRLWSETETRRREWMERRLEILTFPHVEQRLQAILLELAQVFSDSGGNGDPAEITLKQKEVGSLIRASRETVSTALNHFAREGLVHLRRGLITIPCLATLAGTEVEIHRR